MIWIRVAVCGPLAAINGVRWLRVAQREHYLPGRVIRFAWRWRVAGIGLGLRGRRPGPLAWTRRLRTLAAVWAILELALIAASWPTAIIAVILTPALVDIALFITRPVEDALAGRWVDRAKRRLDSVRPTVVAITGSYGKTSTKTYVAHLVAPARNVVASPGSFNNRAGLARAINEHLAPGTDVFVAEMGTYGKGEIRAMCAWAVPKIGAITAIGPVHLERFKSEDVTVAAKAEILERAEVAVLNGDDARLAALAATRDQRGDDARLAALAATRDQQTIVTHASDPLVASAPAHAAPTNVAVAIAIARELDIPEDVIAAQLPSLPVSAHRLEPTHSDRGFTVLDDTFNSNPAGARKALDALVAAAGNAAKRVVVTPGMYELGRRQPAENESFAKAASAVATHVVIVGRTNRASLLAGAPGAITVRDREAAVAWVRANLGTGDVVLYENDHPDHYP